MLLASLWHKFVLCVGDLTFSVLLAFVLEVGRCIKNIVIVMYCRYHCYHYCIVSVV